MPIHRIPRATLHEILLDITRAQSEKVVDITLDGDVFVVLTEFVAAETRSAS